MEYMEHMTFGEALEEILKGNRVARHGWNGKDMYIAIQMPNEHSKMTVPYIYMKTAQDELTPWLASQADILSKDWFVV